MRIAPLAACLLWLAGIAGADTQTAEQQTEAMRWSRGADLALAPATGEMPARWLNFYLSGEDLSALLETALSHHREHPLVLTGARAQWNPLRPWPNRIFALELWRGTDHWQLLPPDQGLVQIVLPADLLQTLQQDMQPWMQPPALRHRSGVLLAHPARLTGPTEQLTEWQQAGLKELSPLSTSPTPPQFGFQPVLNLAWQTWFARATFTGWLTGLTWLLALLVAAAVLRYPLIWLRRRMIS